METVQIDILITSSEQGEIITAELADFGFHGFQQNEKILSAFILKNLFDENVCQSILSKFELQNSKRIIANYNWNQQWENEFKPVVIDSFVAVRASFHQPIVGVDHEIIITPKMSFGTGHHATTLLMLQQMREINFQNKRVLDFGTGTGVLAILASKMGASSVTAIDNDDWSLENASENIKVNNCSNILLQRKSSILSLGRFDIILPNLNLNALTASAINFKTAGHACTEIMLSGILSGDKKILINAFSKVGLTYKSIKEKEGWISMKFYMKNE